MTEKKESQMLNLSKYDNVKQKQLDKEISFASIFFFFFAALQQMSSSSGKHYEYKHIASSVHKKCKNRFCKCLRCCLLEN